VTTKRSTNKSLFFGAVPPVEAAPSEALQIRALFRIVVDAEIPIASSVTFGGMRKTAPPRQLPRSDIEQVFIFL